MREYVHTLQISTATLLIDGTTVHAQPTLATEVTRRNRTLHTARKRGYSTSGDLSLKQKIVVHTPFLE